MDIVWTVSLAHCLLVSEPVSDCLTDVHRLTDTDCPLPTHYWLHMHTFISDRRPHHLMIVFPSCTLRIGLLPDVFRTRYALRVPPWLRLPADRHHLVRRF
jgi:hypothetical protein